MYGNNNYRRQGSQYIRSGNQPNRQGAPRPNGQGASQPNAGNPQMNGQGGPRPNGQNGPQMNGYRRPQQKRQGNPNYANRNPYNSTMNSLRASGMRVQNAIATGNYRGLSNEIRNSVNSIVSSINKPLYNTAPNPLSNMQYLAGEQSTIGMGIGSVISMILCVFFAILVIIFLPVGLAEGKTGLVIAGVILACFCGASIFAFRKCQKSYRVSANYNLYRGAIISAQSEFVSIHRLALTVRKSDEETEKNVEIFIEKGLLPQAKLSDDKKTLLLSDRAAGYYQKTEEYRKNYGVHISNIEKNLNELKDATPQIQNQEMTEKLYHTVSLVEAILSNVKKDNENVKKVLTFESYYLPTTVKLVHSYIELEHSQNSESEKKASLKEISDSIDSINEAFDTILKNMTTIDTSDVMSDMAAMETMMKQDGLI